MVVAMKCQAALNFGVPKKTVAPVSGVPIQPALGFSRPQAATFATSGALAYGRSWVTSTVSKLPINFESTDSDDGLGSLLGKRDKAEISRPVFRSALEQVSYETNNSLSEVANEPFKRQTMAGRIARMLKR